MDIEKLPKKIHERAINLGVKVIHLEFSGGNDEGFLNVNLESKKEKIKENQSDLYQLELDINEWAEDAYQYSGAGDGSEYGDDIVYDLENKKATCSSWYTTRVKAGSPIEDELEVEKEEEQVNE